MQAIMILTGKNTLALAQDPMQIEQARHKTAKLNQFILKKARASDSLLTLASPVTGGGVEPQGYEMLFMLAMQFGHSTPETIAKFAWGLLKQRGIRLYHQGQALETDADNLDALQQQVAFFLGEPTQLYQALGII